MSLELSRFLPAPPGVAVVFTEIDAVVLADLIEQLLGLLGEEDEPPKPDSLEAIVGPLSGPSERPADAALARLLPDAYPDDPEAAGDFRRFTEGTLRSRKRSAARQALATLQRVQAEQTLDDATAQAWLATLNDLRLVIGTRIGVDEDYEDVVDALDPEDPRRHGFAVYEYLTYLQDSLLSALPPASSGPAQEG